MVKNNGDGEEKKEEETKAGAEVEKEVSKEVEEAVNELESVNGPEGEKVVAKPKKEKAGAKKASKRSKHTDEFKKKVIKEKEKMTYAEVQKKYGVYASQIVTWKKELK